MVKMTRYLYDLIFKMFIRMFICATHITPFNRKGETKQKEYGFDITLSMCNGVFKSIWLPWFIILLNYLKIFRFID